MRLTSANRWRRRHWPPDAMPRWCYEFVDSRLRRSPPDRASAVPYGQAGENAMRFPHLAHRSAAAHKLHSTPQQDRMNLISGNLETSSRLPVFSFFLPGSCPINQDRRSNNRPREAALESLFTHCSLRKYSRRASTWFGLAISPANAAMRFGLKLEGEWKENPLMEEAVRRMPAGVRPDEIKVGLKAKQQLGRNDPCPCGSGRKYKKCCLRS